MQKQFDLDVGEPYPLGSTADENGVNFSIFSAHAEKMELCLFDESGRKEIARIPLGERTEQVWHVYVVGLNVGALYGYRAYGIYDPHIGHRFNPHKLVLDPYAKKLNSAFVWSEKMFAYDQESDKQDLVIDEHDNANEMPKCVVVDDQALKLMGAGSPPKPKTPWNKTIIYEAHVKGFTKMNSEVPESVRGTFAGMTHPDALNYLKRLGVTAIELLPVHAFIDEHFLVDHELTNYWGYNTLSFFTPHGAYMASDQLAEFKNMVDVFHGAGIEVILDVVFNHTAEGNHLGPTLSFRGIDNASYYSLADHDNRFYVNDTGCGNTFNLKHPRVLQLVMDSLRYWAEVMGVDGFRFDLATVLGRESYGFDPGSGFFDAIRQDPVLASCKMIAEPWDIGPGGYQLGNYPVGWSEWNDRYRDTLRRFWRGDSGILPEFARRIHGSSDMFEHSGRGPSATINFITSHDGFTLNDLVSYKNRDNLVNKENNNDGHHSNFSDNYGEEGKTKDSVILELRARQKRNLIATLFLSQGTPMLLAGDELGHSQNGNNNAYCQDNEINWLDWKAFSGDDRCLQLFTRYIISLRNTYSIFVSRTYIHRPDEPADKDDCLVRWVGPSGAEMSEAQWKDQHAHALGWVLENNIYKKQHPEKTTLLILFNAGGERVSFTLPPADNVLKWNCMLDTYEDDGVPQKKEVLAKNRIILPRKSMQLLAAVY